MISRTITIVAVLLVMLAALGMGMGGPAQAQVLDYGKLFGDGASSETPQQSTPAQSAPVGPAQSTPRFDPASGPTAEDYGVIADSVPDPMLNATRQAVSVFRARLVSTLTRLPQAWREILTALAAASPTGKPGYFVGIAIFGCLLLVIGRAIANLYAVYIARRLFIGIQKANPQGYRDKLPVLAYRVLLMVIGVSITLAIATLAGLVFYQEHEASLITVIVVFAAYAAILLVDTIWRMTLAPYMPEYRLPHVEDGAARGLYHGLSAISAFGILSMAFCYWMQALGLSSEVHLLLLVLLSLITVLMLLVLIRVHRATITGIVLAGQSRREVSYVALTTATLWPSVVTVYLLFSWGDMSFRAVMGIEAGGFRLVAPYAIFMAGLIVYAVASYVIERIFARNRAIAEMNRALEAQRQSEEQAEAQALTPAHVGDTADTDGDGDEEGGSPGVDTPAQVALYAHARPGLRTMEQLARRIAALFAIGAMAYGMIRFWGGADIFERYPALSLLEDVIDIAFVGYIAFHATRIWIDERIAEEGGDELPAGPGEGEGGGAGATRLATLLPLFRNFFLIVIFTTVALLIAMKMGINVAPLFAGAGIVGLAIGFGAQTLVRDILSGAFFLMDDAFRKGEYIDVGEVKGTVEKISLRSFQLRHHLGMLHTIPFGEITHLTNFSRDWVMMKLPLRLTYDTDPEKVRKLVKKLGIALLDDPEIGPKFIQPLKSQGVIMMEDSAMIVRVKFMTHPGEQWVIRKRIFAELRELFAREGIKFAHREVTVRIPDLDENRQLTADEKQAIGAAARRVGDQVDEEMIAAGPMGPVDVR